jgi:hypothetical protein
LVLIIKTLIHYNSKPVILTILRFVKNENIKEVNIRKIEINYLEKLFVIDSNDLVASYRSVLYVSKKK